MIYTGYFGELNKVPGTVVPISIARYNPRGSYFLSYKQLAPPPWLVYEAKSGLPRDEFKKLYYNTVLAHLDISEVVDDLYTLSQGKDVILLCYEKNCEECHRQFVTEWLQHGCREWQ